MTTSMSPPLRAESTASACPGRKRRKPKYSRIRSRKCSFGNAGACGFVAVAFALRFGFSSAGGRTALTLRLGGDLDGDLGFIRTSAALCPAQRCQALSPAEHEEVTGLPEEARRDVLEQKRAWSASLRA